MDAAASWLILCEGSQLSGLCNFLRTNKPVNSPAVAPKAAG